MEMQCLIIKNKLQDLLKIVNNEDKTIIEKLIDKYSIDSVPETLREYRVCIKCSKTKHEDEFIKWRIGVQSKGNNFQTGNICHDCVDYAKSEKYLKKQIDNIMEKPNYDVIKSEHIEFKTTLLKLKRKLKDYATSKQ